MNNDISKIQMISSAFSQAPRAFQLRPIKVIGEELATKGT